MLCKNSIIYSLSANEELTKEVAKLVGIKIGNCEVMHFADGEILVENYTTVRGKDVYIIQSTCTPATESLMELLFFVDSLKRASAKSITVVVPYYGYSRQDRKAKPREPITSKLVASMLETAGINHIIVCDLHAPQIQGFFNCPVDDLSAVPMFGKYFRDKLNGQDIVIVSPDHGGVTRARKMSQYIDNSTIAIIDKRRPKPNVAEVMSIIGDVKDKVAIIIDDIVDTAGTLTIAASALKKAGAVEVYAAATHGILSNPAIERIANSELVELVISDSISLPEEKKIDKIKVLTVANMLAKAIEYIQKGSSMNVVYDLYKDKR